MIKRLSLDKFELLICGLIIVVIILMTIVFFCPNKDVGISIEKINPALFSFDVKIHYDKLPADKLIQYQYEIMKNYSGAETLEFYSETIDININKVIATAGKLMLYDDVDDSDLLFVHDGVKWEDTEP